MHTKEYRELKVQLITVQDLMTHTITDSESLLKLRSKELELKDKLIKLLS